jgi:proteasome lid subunit RPN8/RPN11
VVNTDAFVVHIPRNIYVEMVAHIVAAYPNEGCGALGTVESQAIKHYPAVNAAENPNDFSIIGDADLLRIFNAVDEYDGEMLYYHSHPTTEAYPSQRDKDYAKDSGVLYLIFSHRFYPEEPYARIFAIAPDETVVEGRVEVL